MGLGMANVVAERTTDAYSYGLHYHPKDWIEIIQWILDQKLTPFDAEMIVRSKLMRWTSDFAGKEFVTLKDFKKYNKDPQNFRPNKFKNAMDDFLMSEIYNNPETKKFYMKQAGYNDLGQLIKEDAMGGVAAPMATLNNTPGMGSAVPGTPKTGNIGSGDQWTNGQKKKKKKKVVKKIEEDNINPYDKLGNAMAKKMGVKTPFKKKKDSKNQNAMVQKEFRIMPYEEYKNLRESKNNSKI
jgi:hypothetical protein